MNSSILFKRQEDYLLMILRVNEPSFSHLIRECLQEELGPQGSKEQELIYSLGWDLEKQIHFQAVHGMYRKEICS